MEIRTPSGHADGVRAIAISPDNRTPIGASEDGKIKLWNLRTGESIRTLTGHPYGVKNVALSHGRG